MEGVADTEDLVDLGKIPAIFWIPGNLLDFSMGSPEDER